MLLLLVPSATLASSLLFAAAAAAATATSSVGNPVVADAALARHDHVPRPPPPPLHARTDADHHHLRRMRSLPLPLDRAAAASATTTTGTPTSTATSTIDSDPGVYPGGSNADRTGWRSMPQVAGFTLDTATIKVGKGVLAAYISSEVDRSRVKRAVIQIHGDNRDSWNQALYASLGLQRAVEGGTVRPQEVVIVAPQFFIETDAGAYPVSDSGRPSTDVMYWADSSAATKQWGAGGAAAYPDNAPSDRMTSFDALDAAVAYFLDRSAFPQLQNVVVAGFSMGAQLVSRYATMRPRSASQSDEDRVRYWVSSPASFVYLSPQRPFTVGAACRKSYDDYKYGLGASLPDYLSRQQPASSQSADVLASRLVSRRVAWMVGVEDLIQGDARCEANAQGPDHVRKIQAWTEQVLPSLPGANNALPSNHSVDYVASTSHQDYRLIQSDPGVQRLFLDDYDGPGKSAKPPPRSNGLGGVSASQAPQPTSSATNAPSSASNGAGGGSSSNAARSDARLNAPFAWTSRRGSGSGVGVGGGRRRHRRGSGWIGGEWAWAEACTAKTTLLLAGTAASAVLAILAAA